jgi:hypothetical protein
MIAPVPENYLKGKHRIEQAVVDAYCDGLTRANIEAITKQAIDDYEKGLGASSGVTK